MFCYAKNGKLSQLKSSRTKSKENYILEVEKFSFRLVPYTNFYTILRVAVNGNMMY